MGKYLELFRGEVGDLTEKTKLENKPYVCYSTKLGKVTYTVVPASTPDEPVIEGPANNEIWYTSSNVNGNRIPYTTDAFGANIVSNTDEDGKGVITFDGDVTSVGDDAFNGCASLTSIVIPDSVTSIGVYAFGACGSLTSITIPNSVTSIDEYSLYGCYFTKANFVNNSSLDAEANNYWSATIVDVEQEDGLLIKNNTVVNCRPFSTSVIIPSGVTSIGNEAFGNCFSLTSITIPNSVMSIGWEVFSYHRSISITFEGTKSEWKAIDKEYDWNCGGSYITVYCTDGNITEEPTEP